MKIEFWVTLHEARVVDVDAVVQMAVVIETVFHQACCTTSIKKMSLGERPKLPLNSLLLYHEEN